MMGSCVNALVAAEGNYKSHMMVHLHTSIGAGDLDIIAVENGSQSI